MVELIIMCNLSLEITEKERICAKANMFCKGVFFALSCHKILRKFQEADQNFQFHKNTLCSKTDPAKTLIL